MPAKTQNGTYVLVIEEINRGNPASIFGELLTLLEADKRTSDNALTLAYQQVAGERFHIPPNLYVIGTMNLADRSLALVDFALRRRFAFFDLEPVLNDTWREWVHRQCEISTDFLTDISRRIDALNNQITDDPNLGRQFRIGHSFVVPKPGEDIAVPGEWFIQVVETEVAPLLREYWFNDPGQGRRSQVAAIERLMTYGIETLTSGFIGRIPVRNIWLLLLYASQLYRELPASRRVDLEDAPDDIPTSSR